MIKSVKVWTGYRANAPFEIDSDLWYTCYGLLHSQYGTPEPESFFIPIIYCLFPSGEPERMRNREGKKEKDETEIHMYNFIQMIPLQMRGQYLE